MRRTRSRPEARPTPTRQARRFGGRILVGRRLRHAGALARLKVHQTGPTCQSLSTAPTAVGVRRAPRETDAEGHPLPRPARYRALAAQELGGPRADAESQP